MKIEKYIGCDWFTYYYVDSKTNRKLFHGLCNDYYDVGIGYHYHRIEKGFWLKDKRW